MKCWILPVNMVQALTILSALQLFSEGVPGADGSGEPYGINRGVVEGAQRAGVVPNPRTQPREFDGRPAVPALSQVVPTSAPSSNAPEGGEAHKTEVPSCNGASGVLRFERLADVRRAPSSSDSDVVRLSEIPSEVLFKCQNHCLKDETSNQGGHQQLCGSLDFVPGKRFSTYSPTIEYTESKCFLTLPDENPAQPPKYEKAKDYYHYREVCYSGTGNYRSAAETDCPERFYVMERVMGKRFMPKGAKEHNANSLEECEQLCLNQVTEDPLMATSICRSGTFDHQRQRCYLSTFTRRTHTYEFVDDPVYDYFENTCLDVERRCPKNKLYWTKEVNAEMTGPYDFVIVQNSTLDDCKVKCLTDKNIFCRSIEFDDRAKSCVLSDEDSVSRPEHIRQSASNQNIYLELTCIDGFQLDTQLLSKPGEKPSQDRQPLTDRNLREVQTAFQLFRNRKLELSPGFRERGREGQRVSLAECLDACLEERAFHCRSTIYSERHRTCRLSEYDQLNGNLGFDPDYHYFENLMSGGIRTDSSLQPFRPGDEEGSSRFRPINIGATDSGRFSSSSGFESETSSGGSSSRFNAFNNRFGSNTRFGSEDRFSSGSTFGNKLDQPEDRFNNAFNRFHESTLGSGSGSRLGGGSRFGGGGGSRVTGIDRFVGGTADGPASSGAAGGIFTRRGGGSGGSESRFSGASPDLGLSSGTFGIPPGTFGSSVFGSLGPGSSLDRPSFGGSSGNTITDEISEGSYDELFSGGSNSLSSSYVTSFDLRPNTLASFSKVSGSNPQFRSGTNFAWNAESEDSFNSLSRPSSGFNSMSDTFETIGTRLRLRSPYIRRFVYVSSLDQCKEDCLREHTFTCLSFNYRYAIQSRGENCELSDVDAKRLDIWSPSYFETDSEFDVYARQRVVVGGDGKNNVSQQCNPDGSMEFMLRTADPFRGRIYTFGYYDRCFYRGGGSAVNMLKISPPRGFPDCGTTRYGETTTNIVVVQFADGVMTSLDKRYNLTCTTVGPGDAVVTSSYIGASLGAPIPIEYLPEESRLDSQVRLQILYSGRPTTTVAVGDPLTFKIESLAGVGLVSDIFASNVVARDPISGRAIELIDSRGCPVQTQVFPALGKARSGDGLETRFSAFKIPESNMVVFEAKVRMCRRECEPALCSIGPGRSESVSYGRRRRSTSDDTVSNPEEGNLGSSSSTVPTPPSTTATPDENPYQRKSYYEDENEYGDVEANVNEIIRVYLNEDDAQEFRDVEAASLLKGVCVPPSEYYSLLVALFVSIFCLCASLLLFGFCYRRQHRVSKKNASADALNPRQKHGSAFPGAHPRTVNQPARQVYFPSRDSRGRSTIDVDMNATSRGSRFPDPSEPIYTNPTLFEKSPSREEIISVKF